MMLTFVVECTTINCNGSMIRDSNCKGDNVWWNQSLFYRVNDFGDQYPDPKYQGWYYYMYDDGDRENFRFTFDGKFETHSFRSWRDKISPLGATNFYSDAISERGKKCQQGKYINMR